MHRRSTTNGDDADDTLALVTGCGCLAVVAAVIAAVIFLFYASTDPGPPVETRVRPAH